MSKPQLIIQKLHENAKLPVYAHETDSGFDLCCLNDFTISPGETVIVPTGLMFEIPKGYEVQVRSRSGLATQGFSVLNSPGTIDEGYRGEIKIILNWINVNDKSREFKAGSKIAQGVLSPVTRALIIEGGVNQDTDRSDNGFGSTGI